MSRPYESVFSPYKRINDRINSISTSTQKLRQAKDLLDKDYRGVIHTDQLHQLRTIRYLKNAEGVREHMKKLAAELRPKFDIVLNTLQRELGGTGLATWTKPKGGYFIAIDTLDNCAKETVDLAKKAGVVLTGAGATFPYKRAPRDRNIRIAPTYPTVGELQKAIELFCVCVKLAGVNKLLESR